MFIQPLINGEDLTLFAMAKDVVVSGYNEITINKWDVNAAKHALDDMTKEVCLGSVNHL